MVFLFDAGIRAGMAGIIGMLAGGVTALCSAPLSVTASTDENDSQRSGQHLYWKLNEQSDENWDDRRVCNLKISWN